MFNSTPESLIFKSPRADDPRLGDFVKILNSTGGIEKNSFCIIGYPDDEGIKNNGGRIGAANAPNVVRKYLYKTTPALLAKSNPRLFDLGNLSLEQNLTDRHEIAKKNALQILNQGAKLVSIGGGHDYGFPDGAAFLEHCKNLRSKPLVINFDAHLDVRPDNSGINSGTPFFRLLSNYNDFDFIEFGIQQQCNSKNHLNWLKDKKVKVITIDQINDDPNLFYKKPETFIQDFKQRPTFLSVDIDAFSSAYAPGCSQSWSTGIDPNNFFILLNKLISNLNIINLGVYEVSPPLDIDDRTSKLAAQIINKFISHE